MKSFTYQNPTSIQEALTLLASPGLLAKPLAGGTDLLVQMRRGRFQPDVLVDVKRIPELTQIIYDPVQGLTIGAAVICAALCEHPEVQQLYPGLIDAVSIIGGTAIQGRATVGGNLCNAAPSGDSIPALIVLGATATVAKANGQAGAKLFSIPVAEFCTAPGKTRLAKGDLLVAVHVPPPAPLSGAAYLRFTPRHEMDIAVAGAGVWVRLSEDRAIIAEARIALSAVAPTPLPVQDAGDALAGQPATDAVLAQAADLAMQAARPIGDVRGTAEHRRHLVGVLVKRALNSAIRRAQHN
ncbi:MAG: xanthine dehydrogenase family protein subunit M [Anaerolineae bacterium]|nr:xanthine dehydrogenase family protein subunit M [Anaerolineae bacterium]